MEPTLVKEAAAAAHEALERLQNAIARDTWQHSEARLTSLSVKVLFDRDGKPHGVGRAAVSVVYYA